MSTRQYGNNTGNKRSAPSDRSYGNGNANGNGRSSGYKGKSDNFSKPGQGQKRDFRPTKPQPQWANKPKPAQQSAPKEAAVRRKRPVTQGGGSEEEVENDDEDDEMEDDAGEGAATAGGEDGAPPEKRPKLSKAEKTALHAAQPHRTALLPSHPLLHGTLLPLWETARRADLGKEERKVAVKELYEAAKGRVAEVSRGHKGGRVLQTVRSRPNTSIAS